MRVVRSADPSIIKHLEELPGVKTAQAVRTALWNSHILTRFVSGSCQKRFMSSCIGRAVAKRAMHTHRDWLVTAQLTQMICQKIMESHFHRFVGFY